MTSRLVGRIALVTGAGSGIGLVTAMAYLREGATVFFADVDEERACEVVADAGTPHALAITMDITDEDQVSRGFNEMAAHGFVPNVVVANAGIQLIGRDAPIHALDVETWRQTINTNLTGTFFTVKHAVRAMLSSGGSIIIMGSPTGITGEGHDFTAYAVSKAGIHGLSRTVAAAYAKQGIRVNTVIPGFTVTPLTEAISRDDYARSMIVARIPMGRAGTVKDLEGIMVYLASDESSYATGSMFIVDGGMTTL